jgi:GH15 family glucan-1,4-alpha-glucosidase
MLASTPSRRSTGRFAMTEVQDGVAPEPISGIRADLVETSLRIIRSGQTPSGAFLASPTYPVYRYSWFRDGAFIAHTLDLYGESNCAERFYQWGSEVIRRQRKTIRAALRTPIGVVPKRYLHTRYRPDGSPGREEWPDFQLDGFGTFLWGIVEHLRRAGGRGIDAGWAEALEMLVAYLSHLWRVPNYDCWEEFPDEVHLSTLCALHGGLSAVSSYLDHGGAGETAAAIRSFILDQVTPARYLPKFIGSTAVDASLLWACVPFDLLPADHPVMERTARIIEADLADLDGGVHRYAEDSYYGGGQWILLAALLGEYLVVRGDRAGAERIATWIEGHADTSGELPEQVPNHLNVPSMYEPWVSRRGPIACPLLWSHAAYLRLRSRLEERARQV